MAVLQRPELGITFTKLHCWRLTQYEKCVFIDADALVSERKVVLQDKIYVNNNRVNPDLTGFEEL